MFEFLQCMYRLGRVDDVGLARYVQAGRLTEEECNQIAGKDVTEDAP